MLTLGVSSMAVPMIAWVHGATGGFYWLFVLMGALAIVALAGAFLLPDSEAATPERRAPAAPAE